MSRIQKIKKKIHENRYNIAAVGIVAGIVALAWYSELKVLEREKENKTQRDNFIVEQNRLGRTVFQLADGSYIGVAVTE